MAKSAKKKQGGKRPAPSSKSDDDWLSSLVKKSSSSEQPSKAERIERRKAKKQRRDERTAQQNPNQPHERHNGGQQEHEEQKDESERQSSRDNLRNIAKYIQTCVANYEIKKRNMYQPTEPKGKATALAKKDKWTEDTVQPRRRDYGGLGMARPSMWMELNHPSFMPLLQEEFSEHVPGFFGKQRTKAMKKQLDGDMLWRQLAEKRVDAKKLKRSGVNGERLAAMSSDERVEAMIRAGFV